MHKNNLLPVNHLIRKTKTRTLKYTLGKRGKIVSVLIKNNTTRKKIQDEHNKIKRNNILDIKKYLRNKNLIKIGTNAPNDVLRTMYEESILSGDLNNTDKENIIHNFVSNK
jgi:hypothetical protein